MVETHSFTSSSELEKRFNGPPKGVFWCVLILGVVEMALRCCDPRDLIPYERGLAHYYTIKLTLDELGAADIVFVGSSRVMRGVNAPLVESELQALGNIRTVANYGVGGAQLHVIKPMLRYLLGCEKKPSVVAIGVSPRTFSVDANPTRRSAVFWDCGDWWSDGKRNVRFLSDVIRNEISKVSLIVRYRRTPLIKMKDWVRGRGGRNPVWGGVVVENRLTETAIMSVDQVLIEDVRRHVRDDLVAEGVYPFLATNEEILVEIARECRNVGVRVVFFEVPDSPLFTSCLPLGTKDEFRRRMSRVAASAEAPWLPISAVGVVLDNSHFADPVHMNNDGAEVFSRALAGRLFDSPSRIPVN